MTRFSKNEFAFGRRRCAGASNNLIINSESNKDHALCLATFVKCKRLKRSVLRKEVIADGLLDWLSAEGKTGCFPLRKSGRFVFAEPTSALSARRTVTILVFRLRRKTLAEQKEIAFGRKY